MLSASCTPKIRMSILVQKFTSRQVTRGHCCAGVRESEEAAGSSPGRARDVTSAACHSRPAAAGVTAGPFSSPGAAISGLFCSLKRVQKFLHSLNFDYLLTGQTSPKRQSYSSPEECSIITHTELVPAAFSSTVNISPVSCVSCKHSSSLTVVF